MLGRIALLKDCILRPEALHMGAPNLKKATDGTSVRLSSKYLNVCPNATSSLAIKQAPQEMRLLRFTFQDSTFKYAMPKVGNFKIDEMTIRRTSSYNLYLSRNDTLSS